MSQVYLPPDELGASTAKPRYSQFDIGYPRSQLRISYRVELRKGQDSWIIAKCLDVKGAVSQGRNIDEALRNIVEAISLILEDRFGEKAQEFLVTWEEK